jgi:hypothetical protein
MGKAKDYDQIRDDDGIRPSRQGRIFVLPPEHGQRIHREPPFA